MAVESCAYRFPAKLGKTFLKETALLQIPPSQCYYFLLQISPLQDQFFLTQIAAPPLVLNNQLEFKPKNLETVSRLSSVNLNFTTEILSKYISA